MGNLKSEGKLTVDFSKLDRAFNPKCVAIVGDSKSRDFEWLRGQSSFTGRLYSVHTNPETINHIKAFSVRNCTSLMDIPEPIDLAIVAVSRSAALRVLEDCIRKEVAAAHFFAAGFAETGTAEGLKLEHLLTERAKEANFHLIGPNCMGIFNPKIGLKQCEEQYLGICGPVGLISQSGTYAVRFSLEAHLQGVDINKSVSFGNGIVLDSTDYLEYFSHDPEIRVIGMYLEGVKDGRRLFRVLRDVCVQKPVVIWKGGRTQEGQRAIASHTGALTASKAIWDAAVRQCGAIKVAGMEELIDTLKALLYLSPVHGDRVAVVGRSGGHSVSIADVLVESGLRVPLLTQESYDELATFFDVVGGSYRNPVDTSGPVPRDMRRTMEILVRDDNIDNLLLIMSPRPGRSITLEELQSSIDLIEHIRRRTSKPVIAIVFFSTPDAEKQARGIILKLQEIGIPVFPSIERGALALKNALDYYRLKSADV